MAAVVCWWGNNCWGILWSPWHALYFFLLVCWKSYEYNIKCYLYNWKISFMP